MPDSGKNPYRRLRGQMFLVLLCFGLIPLIAMGIAGFLENRKAIETRMRNALEAMVKNRKATVELFLEETMRQLGLVTAACSVQELSNPRILESLRNQMRGEKGAILDLGLIADDGKHVAYVGPYKLQDLDYSGQPWFEQVMVLGRYQSDVYLGFRRFPHMVMAVKKREAGRDWILRATIDTDLLSALVREGGLESGAEVFILNRAGEYQTRYSDKQRLMEKADINPVPLHSGVRVVEEWRDGHRELLATAWLPGDSWVLVARQQAPRISWLLDAHSTVIWLLILGLVAVPVLSYVITRHRLKQIRALEAERGALYESIAQSQKMAAIGRLAAGVAHEINNPLAIIQQQVGVLSDTVTECPDLTHAAEFRERIAKIEAQVERGRKVTHRLLGFSRRVGSDREPVNVAAALDETVSFVEKELEASRIRIVREYSPDLPIVHTNRAQMQQVFLNLINNAVDAVRQDGELRLLVQSAEGQVVVKVADTGPGIPTKDLARVFEPFFSTKSGDRHHAGLGLAICQEIMRGLGGGITVESTSDTGTAFSVWFPLEIEVASGQRVDETN
jgi:two-component system NtrC family sensor kinase